MLRGNHALKVWTTTQATVDLSFAEAELIAAVRGGSEGTAMRSVVQDLGFECALRLRLDSSAAIGICRRTGVGRVCRLNTWLMWIQEQVRDGGLEVVKIAGPENPADLMTKLLGADRILEHMK